MFLLGTFFPIRVVFSIFADLVREVALPLVSAKVHADSFAILELGLVGEGVGNWSAFLHMEQTHL